MASEGLRAALVRDGIEPEMANRMVALLDNLPSEAEMRRVVDAAQKGKN